MIADQGADGNFFAYNSYVTIFPIGLFLSMASSCPLNGSHDLLLGVRYRILQ